VPRYGERDGQEPRSVGINRPTPTPVPDGNQGSLAAVYLAQHNGGSRGPIGRPAGQPLSTATVEGSQQQVVAASMLSLKGSERRDGSCEDPHVAICASGQHSAVVTLPLMTAYYSTGGQHARVDDPSLTVPTKARFGLTQCDAIDGTPLTAAQWARAKQVADFLRRHGCWDDREIVTLSIRGITYVIIDIGMRMLTPRELARAQGFPETYILDPIYKGKPLSETEQRHKIGNSVCEKPAKAVIVANYRPPMEWGVYAQPFMEAAE
jgi:DNA (cytosine-5)-methyltransferase 1